MTEGRLFKAKNDGGYLDLINPNDPFSVGYRRKYRDYNVDEYFIPSMKSEFFHYFPNGWIDIKSKWFGNKIRFHERYKRIGFKDFLWVEFGLISDRSLVQEKYDDPMYNHVLIIRERYGNRKYRQSILDQRFSFNHICGGLSLEPVGDGMDRVQICKLYRKYRRPTLNTSVRRQRHPHNILSTWNNMMNCLWSDAIIYEDEILGRDVYPKEFFTFLRPVE